MLINDGQKFVDVAGELQTANAVIANGAALSGAVDTKYCRLARIDMPAAWSPAALTFLVSNDNSTFRDLYDAFGGEYSVDAAASRAILIDLRDFLGVRYIKVRSGPSGSPVNQAADRTLTLQLVP